MKTRTSQNGVAGFMSRLLHNIKSAALALAALALAVPPAWGAYTPGMQWKDGVSGNLNAAGNWTGGTVPASGNTLGFVNSGAGVSYVTNSAAASYQPRFDKGNFVLVASKTLTANNAFHLASSDGGDTGPASVTKYGDGVAYRIARYEDLGLPPHSRHEYRIRKVWKDGRKDPLGASFYGLTRGREN